MKKAAEWLGGQVVSEPSREANRLRAWKGPEVRALPAPDVGKRMLSTVPWPLLTNRAIWLTGKHHKSIHVNLISCSGNSCFN